MAITGGGSANKQGRVLESTILPCLENYNFEVARYSQWIKHPAKYKEDVVLTNVPYTTIYGHRGFTEFLLLSKTKNLRTRIECKWQQSGGSVDEKLPYLYLNCIASIPEDDIIIIVGGGGMKKGAIRWLNDAVNSKLYQVLAPEGRRKNIQVFSLEDFLRWANHTFGR